MLKSYGKKSNAYIEEEPPYQFEALVPNSLLSGEIDISQYNHTICLDCSNVERLAFPNRMKFQTYPLPVCNIDHHVSNKGFGKASVVDVTAASTCEMLCLLFDKFGLPVNEDCATFLLIGVTQDTGCFRFTNTTSQSLNSGAWLIEKGGDYQRVMGDLYFNTTINALRLQAKVTESLKFAFNNKFAYFIITADLVKSCGARMEDADELVDIIRTLEGVDVVVKIQDLGQDIKFSLRSQNPDRPVIDLAEKIGGGGHKMAAGATLEDATIQEAEALLLSYAKEVLFK